MSVSPQVSVLTPRGRGAVAVVTARVAPQRVDAEPALFRAANGRSLADQPLDRVCFGRWGTDPGEDVLVCRVAPDVTEISCHGGAAAVARIVRDLEQRGCRVITWQDELTASHSLVTTECLTALAHAPTFRTAAILLEQSSGLLERSLAALRAVSERELLRQLDALLLWSEFGRHLTAPWQVVLTGVPNVGKSSLINRLLGYARSIVYDEPGTTRDVVTAPAVFDGWPVELSDTAGLRDTPAEIEAAGVERARRQLATADLAIIVLDRSRPVTDAERRLVAELPGALLVAHKLDLPDAWAGSGPEEAVAVSSLTGEGVDELIARIAARLVPHAPPRGTPIPVSERQVECLRAARVAAMAGDLRAARGHIARCAGRPV